jgi:hypothetical protein
MTGRPVHLKRKSESNWTACGVQSDLAAWDARDVRCLRCRKTKLWKSFMAFEKVNEVRGFRSLPNVSDQRHLPAKEDV